MQEQVASIAGSPWFGLIGGVASMLGFLLAVYPVQIRSVEPSVYRGLIWEKTLTWTAGLGLIVFSTVQIYYQRPPDPGSLPGMLYQFIHRSVSVTHRTVGDFAFNPTLVDKDLFLSASSPIGVRKQGGADAVSTLSQGKLALVSQGSIDMSDNGAGGNNGGHQLPGLNGVGTTGSGLNGVGTTSSVGTDTPISVSEISGNWGHDAVEYGTHLWAITLFMGFILFIAGRAKDPFASILGKLQRLEDEMDSHRKRFLKTLTNISDLEKAEQIQRYDSYRALMRAALFYTLTGYHWRGASDLESVGPISDLRSFASALLSSRKNG